MGATDSPLAPPPGPGARPAVAADDRTWAMLAHLLALVAAWVAPLVIYLVFRDDRPFVARHAKESLHFQITVLLVTVALLPTLCIGVGIVLLPALGVVALVFEIQAAVRANEGREHRYPFALRLLA